MNYLDYLKHIISTPDTYHRSFDKDLPEEDSLEKRTILAALPFLSLYKPAGSLISLVMGGCRICTHLKDSIETNSLSSLSQTMLASIALASSVFNLSVGFLITNSIDTMQGIINLLNHLLEGQWENAAHEYLHITANALYIAFMLTNSLEYMLAFTIIQVLISIFQAKDEFMKDHYIESFGKIAMGLIRAKQGTAYYQTIQRRNALFEIIKYRSLIERSNRGREAYELINHPLTDKTDGNFHGFGKQLVKGENVSFHEKVVDGKEVIELEFKVNHVFRDKLQTLIHEFQSYDPSKVRQILSLTGSHATDLKIETGNFSSHGQWFSAAHKITLGGLGTVLVGSDPNSINLYDRVVVQLPSTANIFELHELLAFMNLDIAINPSNTADIDRLKLGHLYRTFFPREALKLERNEEFFTLSFTDLKEKIFTLTPAMKDVFETYFDKMVPVELFPGKVRYRIVGLSDKAYELGARALTAAITGGFTDNELFERVAGLLKSGMLSSESRLFSGVSTNGLGSDETSFLVGGADSVYTQMITEKNCQEQMEFDDFAYHSKVRILINLEALELGTYQYLTDAYGNRLVDQSDFWWFGQDGSYRNRLNILEFTRALQSSNSNNWLFNNFMGHEVMLKERIAPSYIKGLIVPDQETYTALSNYLKSKDINVSTDFIRIGDRVTADLIS